MTSSQTQTQESTKLPAVPAAPAANSDFASQELPEQPELPDLTDDYYEAMFAAKIQVEEDLRELIELFEFIRLEKKYEEEEVRMRKKKVTFQSCDSNNEEDIWDMKEFVELEKWFEEEDKNEKMKTLSKKMKFRKKVVDDDKGGRRKVERTGRKDAVKEMYRGMKDLIEKLK